MWIGSLTHELLARYLQQLTELSPEHKNILKNNTSKTAIEKTAIDLLQPIQDECISLVIDAAGKQFHQSENKSYDSYDKNNKFGLMEHCYETIDQESVEHADGQIHFFREQFLASELHLTILQHLNN